MPPTISCARGSVTRERAEVGRHPAFQKLDQPVARGTGDAIIDRGNEDRVDRCLGEVRCQPFLRSANIDFVVERKHDVVEFNRKGRHPMPALSLAFQFA